MWRDTRYPSLVSVVVQSCIVLLVSLSTFLTKSKTVHMDMYGLPTAADHVHGHNYPLYNGCVQYNNASWLKVSGFMDEILSLILVRVLYSDQI